MKLKPVKFHFLKLLSHLIFSFLIAIGILFGFLLRSNSSSSFYPIESSFHFSPRIQLASKSLKNPDFIDEKLETMTLREKIAQMFIFRAQGTEMTPQFKNFLESTKPGGIILMGDNVSANLPVFTSAIQQTNSKLPLFISIDQEGGLVKRIASDPNPGARILGSKSLEEICQTEKATSELLKRNGINLNFNIVGDVAYDHSSFIYERSFGSDPNVVSKDVAEAIRCSTSTFNTIKHFPGHGRTTVDSHKKTPIIDLSYSEWQKSDALPFQAATNSKVNFLMFGHIIYSQIDSVPASLSQRWHQEAQNLGFNGLMITDAMGMLEIEGFNPRDSLINAVKAGNDVLLYVDTSIPPATLIDILESEVRARRISTSRIDESVRKILRYKVAINSV